MITPPLLIALHKILFAAHLHILLAAHIPLAQYPSDPIPANTPTLINARAFIPHQIDSYQWINDFVLVDVNNDQLLDYASNNHALRPRILINTNNFSFAPPLQSSPFALNQLFNDLTPGFDQPNMDQPGIYLYFDGLWGKIVAKDLDEPLGNIIITGDTDDPSTSFDVVNAIGEVYQTTHTQLEGYKQLKIALGKNFELTIAPTGSRNILYAHVVIPYTVPTSQIFIGPESLESFVNQITFTSPGRQDWHNSIWFDFNADNMLDVFVAQGGINGIATTDSRVFNDMLLLSGLSPLAFDAASETGIVKHGLPGRGAMIADVDNNGFPDIYIRNSRDQPPRKNAPNLLHMQNSHLHFNEEANQRNLNIETPGRGKWIDVDSDGWIDLIWGDDNHIKLFRNKNGIFHEEIITSDVNYVAWISIADFDNDSDIDIAIAAYPQALLLVNNNGKLEPTPFTDSGLPLNSKGIQWVDFDNDGLLDMYARPHGLFQQLPNHTFKKTGILSEESAWHPFAWGDVNNDGRMDLVRRTSLKTDLKKTYTNTQNETVELQKPPTYTITTYENTIENINSWIEIKLVGPSENPQAVGATVLLEYNQTKQLAMVGQFDSSQSSIGHYRLHFGLGDTSQHTDLPSITILWPNGEAQTIKDIHPNQLHTIRYTPPNHADG